MSPGVPIGIQECKLNWDELRTAESWAFVLFEFCSRSTVQGKIFKVHYRFCSELFNIFHITHTGEA